MENQLVVYYNLVINNPFKYIVTVAKNAGPYQVQGGIQIYFGCYYNRFILVPGQICQINMCRALLEVIMLDNIAPGDG